MVGRSIVFASFAINSMVYIFAYRSLRKPIAKMVPLKGEYVSYLDCLAWNCHSTSALLDSGLGAALGVVQLSPIEWATVVGIALLLLGVVEVGKYFANRINNNE